MRLAATVAVLVVLAQGTASAAAEPVLQDVVVAPGAVSSATTMALAPDGRIFVAEQAGRLRVIKDGALLSAPFLTVPVTSDGERGLLGVTLDPNFAVNRFVYVYYTAASPVVNRIVRYTASASNPDVAQVGSAQVIVDGIPSQSGYHNGGALHFGPDGKLYFAVGENHSGGNAQSTSSMAGKLHRINPDGSIPADNPFGSSIWALGLRNPFTFDIERATGRIFINDVGQNTYEEIDETSTTEGGVNFGWPTTEGPTSDSRFRTPFHYYTHASGQCAITGGAFYDPATVNFPAQYAGDYFYADYCGDWIRSVDLTTKAESTLLSGLSAPVDIDVAEDGSLYYLARGEGRVHRVRFVDSGTPPSISAHPQPVTVTAGGDATFTVSATGSAPLGYRWQRNGADIPGATGSSYTLAGAQASDSGAQFRVIVSNASGSATSNAATLTVTSNRPPVPVIGTPAGGSLYSAGDAIGYSGSATDPEDGTVGAARFSWRIDFHHADHVHPFLQPASGSTSGSFAVPVSGHTDANVWYRIHLTVRDSGGLEASTFRDVHPRTARVTLAASAPGLRLELDDQPFTAPSTHSGVVGIQRMIAAPSPQVVDGRVYIFTGWSDGGAATHTITTPASDATYTANYLAVGLPVVAAASSEPLQVTVRAPARARWRRPIPVRVSAPAGTRVLVALRRGERRLAARRATIDADGVRVVRVRARRHAARARLVVSATGPDGQRWRSSRRIVLTRGRTSTAAG